MENLKSQCEEIREFLISTVSKTGGHLAPNLGVVELTLCLHKVFDFSKDKLLFDVGHQSYVHKILTGRKENFHTLRQKNGISPFMDPQESNFDPFISGHAGTALAAGAGIAIANPDKKVIIVVGDAAIANGNSLEAINYIGYANLKNVIIILNDNEMSIGKNIGFMSKFLSKFIRTSKFLNIREDLRGLTDKIQAKKTKQFLERVETSIKNFLFPSNITDIFGYTSLGSVDGHNIDEMLNVFPKAKELNGPLFLHVKTEKGKGYAFAENNQEKFHGISPFNIESGDVLSNSISYSRIVGEEMLKLARIDENIFTLSAGMIKGVGLEENLKEFPERTIDVGIAEGCLVTLAAGLAISGKKPYICIYSTFLQRAFSQIIHDVSIQNLSVVFIVDRSGIVGEDGKTHNGFIDFAFFLTLKNFAIICPTSKEELVETIKFSHKYEGPLVIRIPRDSVYEYDYEDDFQLGKWRKIISKREKNKQIDTILYIATGSMLKELLNIESILEKKGISGTIMSAASIKPLDESFLIKNILNYEHVFVLEEALDTNSFGSSIIEFLNRHKIYKFINKITMSDYILPHSSRNELLIDYCMRGDNLAKRIEELIYGVKQ